MPEEKEMSLLEHLEELRNCLVKSLIYLVVGVVVAFPLAPIIFRFLKHPLLLANRDPETFLMQLNVAGGLSITINLAFWSGLLLAMPFIVYQLGLFIFPGLREQEKKIVYSSSIVAILLFFSGAAMAYFFTSYALTFMFNVSQWIGLSQENVLATDYISFVLKLLIGCGLAFEFPLVLYVLGRLGLVDTLQLKQYRKHVFIGLLFVAMMLTPQDPFSMIAMAIPLYIMYEGCIMLIRRHE